MNSKIKNYVDVLFKDIPNTNKAKELKEELLSTLNDHFEAHIEEGKSENQAYTEALCDLGDVDALLKDLVPEQELKQKIDVYRQKRAKNIAIAVMMYIFSVISVIVAGGISTLTNADNYELITIAGVVIMFILIGLATGLIIYTHMSMPQDVSQYITKNKNSREIEYNGDNKTLRFLAAFMKVYWMIILIVYLGVSFATGKWAITWLIWLIATALKEALYIFFNTNDNEIKSMQE